MADIVRMLNASDAALLKAAEPGVFDDPIASARAAEFLNDPRHHIAGAIVNGRLAGMATGVVYVHPDKPAPELWINEAGVAARHQGRGLGRALIAALLKAARDAGCADAWVVTETTNARARRLYEACGGEAAPEAAVLYEFALKP